MTETMSHHHPAVHQFQFQFPSQAPMVPMAVLLLSLCSSKPPSCIHLSVSPISGGRDLPCVLPSLKDPKTVVNF